jgi:hypothetical protein
MARMGRLTVEPQRSLSRLEGESMPSASHHRTERSETYSVSIAAPPSYVWRALADVGCWPEFSPFALAVTEAGTGEYRIAGPQGEVGLTTRFNEELGLLDHVVLIGQDTVFVAYRVIANLDGSELIMTNIKAPGDSMDDYEEQLRWMRDELDGAKRYIEHRFAADTGIQKR